ncbi:PIN domain-containing protein [Parapedobacter sp. DT-150]|uniref:PIN domain-containing protein n=1 Tax=Parapedobacter sp. DT-150 TaxID=3396162 RepID=UPI003F1DACB1
MSDKVFLDTNIIIYSYSSTEPEKQIIARKLIAETNSYISTQVLTELCNIATKKLKLTYKVAAAVVRECCNNNTLIINTQETIEGATKIAERYGFSFYDSLILSAALNAGCQKLYSEDLQDNQLIEKKLTIINPFVQHRIK